MVIYWSLNACSLLDIGCISENGEAPLKRALPVKEVTESRTFSSPTKETGLWRMMVQPH